MRALLALFVRSLKEDIRARSTYLIRSALVVLVLFFLWITHVNPTWAGAVGRDFFAKVVWIDLFVLTVVGLSYFASAITEEKESETLGLLRMTNLDALSILLGKSTSRLLGALFILAAQLPFMLVAVTMGGLSVHQVLAGFACLLAYVFLLANVGLFASVISAKSSAATVLSGTIIFGLLVLPWWCYGSGQMAAGTVLERGLDAWARATPFVQLRHVLMTGFNESVLGWQFTVSLVAGAIFFALAWRSFEHRAELMPDEQRLEVAAPPAMPQGTMVKGEPTRRVGLPALVWKDFHYVASGDTALLVKGVMVFLIIFLCMPLIRWQSSERWLLYGFVTSTFTGLFLALCLALDGSRIFRKEREQKALSSLFMLPISTRRLVWQKTLGCLKASGPAIVAFLGCLVVLGFAAGAEVIEDIQRGSNWVGRNVFFGLCGFAYAMSTGLSLPVFIAWLSLRMLRGALAVGLTLWFIGTFALATVVGLIAEEAMIVLLPIASVCILIGFWRGIPAKLEQLAAEE